MKSNYLSINYLFKVARESQGLKQKDICNNKKVGITPSSLSQYEAGTASLALDTRIALAQLLNLNPDYVRGRALNPFKTKNLIKILLQSQFVDIDDFSIIYYIVSVNSNLEIMLLSPRSGFEGLVSWTVFDTPVYAVVIKDSDKNEFIFRKKDKMQSGQFIAGVEKLILNIKETADKEGKQVEFFFKRFDKDLYNKISTWNTITKKDIKPFWKSNI